MDASRETPNVTTKPECYDLANMLVSKARFEWVASALSSGIEKSKRPSRVSVIAGCCYFLQYDLLDRMIPEGNPAQRYQKRPSRAYVYIYIYIVLCMLFIHYFTYVYICIYDKLLHDMCVYVCVYIYIYYSRKPRAPGSPP